MEQRLCRNCKSFSTGCVLCKKGIQEACELFEGSKIIEVRTNDEAPDKYSYKYLDVILENGSTERFHYHINNPMPTKEEMIGLTWEETCELARKMFYDKLEANSRARKAEAQNEK